MTEPTPGKDLARVGTYGRSSLTEKQQYAVALSRAGELVPKNFWTKPTNVDGRLVPAAPNPGAILYMLETAAMVGVNPMVGLTNIHIIEGKPSLSANLQAALVREAGHRLRVWVEGSGDSLKAICEIVRSDDPEFTFRVEWGVPEMNAAKLATKDNWVKYRRSMMKARSITECIREACPEVLMGATYSPDELGANTDEMGEPIDLQQVPDHAPQTGAPSEPKPETPIVDERAPETPAEDFDWSKAIRDASSTEDVRALYRRARAEGLLASEIKVGRKKRVLEEVLTEIGTAMTEAEKAAEATVEEETTSDEGEPAVLDPNVVDAEVVEEGS